MNNISRLRVEGRLPYMSRNSHVDIFRVNPHHYYSFVSALHDVGIHTWHSCATRSCYVKGRNRLPHGWQIIPQAAIANLEQGRSEVMHSCSNSCPANWCEFAQGCIGQSLVLFETYVQMNETDRCAKSNLLSFARLASKMCTCRSWIFIGEPNIMSIGAEMSLQVGRSKPPAGASMFRTFPFGPS